MTSALRRRVLPPMRGQRHMPSAGVVLVVGLVGVLVLLPLYRIQQLALSNNARAYRAAFGQADIVNVIVSTVVLAFGSLALALVLGTLLAWAATRLPPSLRLLRLLPIVPILFPAIAAVIGWTFLLSPRPGYLNVLLRMLPWWSDLREGPVDVYTLPWIVLLTGLSLTSYVYLFVNSGFANINGELLEAARASGSSTIGVFLRVTLPLLRPALVYGGAVALLLGLGQFTVPLLLGSNLGINVITTRMYSSIAEPPIDFAGAAALGSPLLVFGILVVLAQRILMGDQQRMVTHGGKSFHTDSRPSRLAVAAIAVYFVATTLLPFGALVIVSLSAYWTGNVGEGGLSLNSFRAIFEDGAIVHAVLNSLLFSLLAVAITLPLGYLCASILLRTTDRALRQMLDFLVAVPLGVPTVVFGVGFLLAYGRDPFRLYATGSIVVLAYVTLMLPFATRMLLVGMISLGTVYKEAARTSGAGALKANLTVYLPLLRTTIGGASALMFVLLTHEFTASLFVRSPTTQVMGTILYDIYSIGSYPLVAATALVMTLVTAIGVSLAVLVGGRQSLERL